MKKKMYYNRRLIFVVLLRLVIAYFIFRMSFALFDTVTAATNQDWVMFQEKAILLIGIVLVMIPLNLFMAYVRGKYVQKTLAEMKNDYIEAVFGKNISEFQKDNNAHYISVLTNDFDLVEKDYLEPLTQVVDSVINFTTSVIIITIISPIILLIAVGVALINMIISVFSANPIKKHNAERSDLMKDYSGFVKEVLSALHIIKANDLEEKVSTSFDAKSKKVQQKKYIIDKIMSFIFAIQNMNGMLTVLGLMLVVSYLTITGVVTFAGVVVIAQNIDNFIGPIMGFSEALPRILSVKVLFKRMDTSLKNKETMVETVDFDGMKESITLENVSFAYEDKKVLENMDITFEKGKKYLIVGPSGGGKSTILRLLRKYFYPSEGSILIDQVPLKDIKKMDYFSKIANIEQQIFLFEDTLLNNLTLYKSYTEDEINQAIEKAGLSDFIAQSEDGLNRMIVDNGKNVSGGEKSRIAIARGLLQKAEIILLDEAFASLDLAKAREIERSVLKLTDCTVINVSHVVIQENISMYDEIITVYNKKAVIQKAESWQKSMI